MKKWIVVFLFMLIIACSSFSGCSIPFTSSEQPSKGTVNVGVGFDKKQDELRTSYSFDEVISSVYLVPLNTEINEPAPSDQVRILSVSGDNIDTRGNASSWTFVVQYQNVTKFVIYDRYGESVTNWSREYSGREIAPEKIVSPATLLETNRGAIFTTPSSGTAESRRLVLSGGNYSLTITGSNGTRLLEFDALNGALISSNER